MTRERMTYRNDAARRAGFTLLEVMVVLVLITVITAIIYATFSTVANSAEEVRADVERVRLEQYLIRSLATNLATVFTDPLYEDANFNFIGTDFENQDGPADSLTFCSTAPLIGGFSLPGDVKLVTYEIPGLRDEDLFLSDDSARWRAAQAYEDAVTGEVVDNPYALGRKLTISETPMMTGNTRSMQGNLEDDEDIFAMNESLRARSRGRDAFTGAGGNLSDTSMEERRRREEAQRRRDERRDQRSRPRPSDFMEEDDALSGESLTNKAMFQTPYMEMPIRTLDIEYFDGEDWVQEWNSSAYDNQVEQQAPGSRLNLPPAPEPMGRLPWAVRFRINFEKPKEELDRDRQSGFNEDEDVDFEMVVPVRQGQGITQHVYEVPELQQLIPGYTGGVQQAEQGDETEQQRGGGGNTQRRGEGGSTQFGTRN